MSAVYISSRFFENEASGISAIWMKKSSQTGFLGPVKFEITLAKEKERRKERARRKKGEEETKARVALLVFTLATLEKKKS